MPDIGPPKGLEAPRLLELEYGRKLKSEVDKVEKSALIKLEPLLTGGSNSNSLSDFLEVTSELKSKNQISASQAERLSEGIFWKLDRQHKSRWKEEYQQFLGIAPSDLGLVEGFLTENVQLITSIPDRLLTQVEGVIIEAVGKGSSYDVLAERIAQRFEVGRSRARLIARDQVATAYSKINVTRQQMAGVERFRWSTSRDERVRPEHRALDRQVFSYPNGHATQGLPGIDSVACRCAPVPVIEF